MLFMLLMICACLGLQAGTPAHATRAAEDAAAGPAAAVLAPSLTGGAGEGLAWQEGPQRVGALDIELLADVRQIVPGEPFRIGLRLRHDPHWHTYWRNPGDTGLPTRFEVQGPAQTRYGDIVWPAPRRFAIGPIGNYGYEGETLLSREVVLPEDFRGRQARFRVHAEWLICRELCVPGDAPLELVLPVGGATLLADEQVALFDAAAAQAPLPGRPPLSVRWWQRGDDAMLLLPRELVGAQAPRSASFLPYFAEGVRPVAEQRLVELSGDDAGTYALMLAIDEQAVRSAEPGWERSGGIVRIDGQRPVEVVLARQTVVPVAGSTLAIDRPVEVDLSAAGAEAGPAGQGDSGGLLKQLQLDGQPPSARTGQAPGGPAGLAAEGVADDSLLARYLGKDLKTLLLTMAAALLGGLILNLMPCVFPVIGLKILSFTEAAAGRPGQARRHALVFCLGVMLTFVGLALLLVGLRSLGQAAGWGFQLQSPVFVAAMCLLFVAIGLNLFGVFEAGASLTRLGNAPIAGAASSSYGSSFLTGVMAVVVATPCTAPFMGSAVGFTLSSSALEVVLVFAALGLGMGIPYLLLASSDRLLARLPRPGPWLQTLRQLLAFPMFGTSVWLVWVLALQTDAQGVLLLLLAALLLSFALWIYGRWQFELRPRAARSSPAWLLLALLALAGGGMLVSRLPVVADSQAGAVALGDAGAAACAKGAEQGGAECASWQPWSAEKVAAAQAAGRPVFVDFTAAWCLTCQLNKPVVLERPEMQQAFRKANVLLLRADWTRRDAAISAELARFGRNSVPFYLYYDGQGGAPRQLPELLTVDIVMEAISRR